MAFNYKDPRWQKRRLEIMERDGWKCFACWDESSELQVHHKRYIGQPWEASSDDLQTLCKRCHQKLGPHPKAGIWYETFADETGTIRLTVKYDPHIYFGNL